MKIEIELNEFTKSVGTYINPMLNIGYIRSDERTKIQVVYFNDL